MADDSQIPGRDLSQGAQSEQLPFFKDYYSRDEIYPGDAVACLWAYNPCAGDEFLLEPGDMIKVVGIWDNGWATGRRLTETAEEWETCSNLRGLNGDVEENYEIKSFPLVCTRLPQRWREIIEGSSVEKEGSINENNDEVMEKDEVTENDEVMENDDVIKAFSKSLNLKFNDNATGRSLDVAIPSDSMVLSSNVGEGAAHRDSVATFITAKSVRSSVDTFHSSQSICSSVATFRTAWSNSRSIKASSAISRSSWYKFLDSEKLIPEPLDEKDWSGRGEHAEFKRDEKAKIDAILTVEGTLGTSATALVESVRCGRVLLARKTIRINRRMKRIDAIKEVKHLKRLEHSHIVRLVGTYTFKQDFAILLYPAADYNLETFMESIIAESPGRLPDQERTVPKLRAIVKFFGCLIHALEFLHRNATKHMDIKPKNLLIKTLQGESASSSEVPYKIYIADFGISRSYKSAAEAETDSWTSFTRMYAAPEVDRKRGLSADIFSLGSVFVEMFGVLATSNRESHRDALIKVLQSNEDQPWRSYQGNINSVRIWLSELLDRNTFNAHCLELYPFSKEVHKMIDFDPAKRPSAAQLVSFFDQALCCTASVGPDYFVANETIQEDEGSVPPRTVQILAQQPYEQKFPLYHACASLQHRFSTNPKLRYWLAEDEKTIVVQRDGVDSVNLIWRLLRRGSPLLLLFDAPINPSLLVNKSWSSQRRQAKRAVALFLSVCIEKLRIPPTECFTITDLYLDDILGFLKVIRCIYRVMPILSSHGYANPSFASLNIWEYKQTMQRRTPTSSIGCYPSLIARLTEFVNSERQYVDGLQYLHDIKTTIAEQGYIDGQVIIFSNLDAVLNFQHRFLINIEKSWLLPAEDHPWGSHFLRFQEGFQLLVPYIHNIPRALEKMSVIRERFSISISRLRSLLVSPASHLLGYQRFLDDLQQIYRDDPPLTVKVLLARGMIASLANSAFSLANMEHSHP